jgi:hypothetical protein
MLGCHDAQFNKKRVIPGMVVIETFGSDTDFAICFAAGKFSFNFISANFNPLS